MKSRGPRQSWDPQGPEQQKSAVTCRDVGGARVGDESQRVPPYLTVPSCLRADDGQLSIAACVSNVVRRRCPRLALQDRGGYPPAPGRARPPLCGGGSTTTPSSPLRPGRWRPRLVPGWSRCASVPRRHASAILSWRAVVGLPRSWRESGYMQLRPAAEHRSPAARPRVTLSGCSQPRTASLSSSGGQRWLRIA